MATTGRAGPNHIDRLRSIILRKEEEKATPCPYSIELHRRGDSVTEYFDWSTLLNAVSGDENEIDVVVLDALSSVERRELVDRLILACPYNPPRTFWITEQQACSPDVSNEFEHELIGDGASVKVILRGDMATFKCRLAFVDGWLKRNDVPTLTLRHSRPAALPHDGSLTRDGCRPGEKVVDALIKGVSLRTAGQHPTDPFRRNDFYTVDLLGRARRPLPAYDLAVLLAAARGIDGVSAHSAKNSVKRIRRALTALGLQAKEVLRTDEDAYTLDRSRIRIRIEHIPE